MPKTEYLVFDAEAYRTRNPVLVESISEKARNARPANNTRKDIKAAWDSPEATEERIYKALADTAKDPLRAEVLCICTADQDNYGGVFDAMTQDRRQALVEFAEFIGDTCGPETIFVGHNIIRYDLPLLLVEWQRHGIRAPDCYPVFRRMLGPGRWFGRVFDTLFNTPSAAPFTSMDDACDLYGVVCADVDWQGEPMDGSRVGPAFEAGEFDTILRYCQQDVQGERDLYLAMTFGNTWGVWDTEDPVTAQLSEIAESKLTPAQKWISALPILQSAGLL